MEIDAKIYINGEVVIEVNEQYDTFLYLLDANNIVSKDGDAADVLVVSEGLSDRKDYSYEHDNFPIIIAKEKVGVLRDRLYAIGYGSEKKMMDPIMHDLMDEIKSLDNEVTVIFDLSEAEADSANDIKERIQEYQHSYNTAIIVTEGTTDIEFISNSIKILYPHLINYITFLDTNFSPELNAEAVIRMAKSFASARTNQNMLFILDNDSAGLQALKGLKRSSVAMPDSIRITQYPTVDLLSNYPTKGPQGDVSLDVNGRAGSIELYLGIDVLKNGSGNLSPVQWQGYISSIDAYQGVVMDKSAIQSRFRTKYRNHLDNPQSHKLIIEEWREMNELIRHILSELSMLPAIDPIPVVEWEDE